MIRVTCEIMAKLQRLIDPQNPRIHARGVYLTERFALASDGYVAGCYLLESQGSNRDGFVVHNVAGIENIQPTDELVIIDQNTLWIERDGAPILFLDSQWIISNEFKNEWFDSAIGWLEKLKSEKRNQNPFIVYADWIQKVVQTAPDPAAEFTVKKYSDRMLCVRSDRFDWFGVVCHTHMADLKHEINIPEWIK